METGVIVSEGKTKQFFCLASFVDTKASVLLPHGESSSDHCLCDTICALDKKIRDFSKSWLPM